MIGGKFGAKIAAAVVGGSLLGGCSPDLSNSTIDVPNAAAPSHDLLKPYERVEAFDTMLKGTASREYPAPMGGLGGDGQLIILGPNEEGGRSGYELLISSPEDPQTIIRAYGYSAKGDLVSQSNTTGRLVNNNPKEDYHYGDMTLRDTAELVRQGLQPLRR